MCASANSARHSRHAGSPANASLPISSTTARVRTSLVAQRAQRVDRVRRAAALDLARVERDALLSLEREPQHLGALRRARARVVAVRRRVARHQAHDGVERERRVPRDAQVPVVHRVEGAAEEDGSRRARCRAARPRARSAGRRPRRSAARTRARPSTCRRGGPCRALDAHRVGEPRVPVRAVAALQRAAETALARGGQMFSVAHRGVERLRRGSTCAPCAPARSAASRSTTAGPGRCRPRRAAHRPCAARARRRRQRRVRELEHVVARGVGDQCSSASPSSVRPPASSTSLSISCAVASRLPSVRSISTSIASGGQRAGRATAQRGSRSRQLLALDRPRDHDRARVLDRARTTTSRATSTTSSR